MIGQTLGHYEILDLLGAGGMGVVYRARDTNLDREVALKVLPAELADDPQRLDRFEREAKTLAALDHPNIVHIYSVEQVDGVRFLTMQLVEGSLLAERISADGLELEDLFAIALPLVDALAAAHERGIVHRDLKPENVMLDREGRVKILDFGLAKLRLPDSSPEMSQLPTEAMTQEGLVIGTVPYMSPEQLQGLPVDARTDLFSFGIMLWEMATGVRPFGGTATVAIAGAILRDSPPSLAEARAGLPAGLEEVLRRCLEKEPQDRFGSARELREALGVLEQKVATGHAPVARRPQRGFMTSKRWLVLLAVFVFIAVLVGVWSSRLERPPPADPEGPQIASLVVLPLQNRSGDPEQEYFADGMTEALITDLSKIGALKVISRTSAMRYKGSDKSLSEIAEDLDVDAVIEGSVLREGNRVGITAQLIEVATDQSLWADRYERDLTSILSLQGEIAQAIAEQIQITLTPEEESLLTDTRQVDPEAYEAVVKGRYHIHRFTPKDFQMALQYFEKALEIDPDYAPAHIGVSRFWGFAMQAGVVPPKEAAPLGRASALRALELDPTLAEAHLGLAGIQGWHDWDWVEAEEGFLRALELDPNFAEARIFYSHFLSIVGRHEEAWLQADRAIELDPLNPFFQALHAVQLSISGRLDAAAEEFRQVFEANPGLGLGHRIFRDVLLAQGRLGEAFSQAVVEFTLRGDLEVVDALEQGYAEGGFKAAMKSAAAILEVRSEKSYVRVVSIVRLYDDAGDTDNALRWIEKGLELRDPNMPYIGKALFSEELRSAPRFQEALRRMNLPPSS